MYSRDDSLAPKLILLVISLMVLGAINLFEYRPPCTEDRAKCSELLGREIDLSIFDEMVSVCGGYSRTDITEIRKHCISSYFKDISYNVVDICYQNYDRDSLLETVKCMQTKANR